jgi:hypothetical protein
VGGTLLATNITGNKINPVIGPSGRVSVVGFFGTLGLNFESVSPAAPNASGTAGTLSFYDGNNNHKMGLEGGGTWSKGFFMLDPVSAGPVAADLSSNGVALWNSNGVIYATSTTKTNLISDLR